jgi:hypothetical protein
MFCEIANITEKYSTRYKFCSRQSENIPLTSLDGVEHAELIEV